MSSPRFWAVIPAAGSGRRMGSDRPKQYLSLAGRRVIEHTLARIAGHRAIAGTVVALSPGDPYWPEVALPQGERVERVDGGTERCHSVLNALARLAELGDEADWVLVHDAARPCLRVEDIDHLIGSLRDHPVGGLLALPVADTLKRGNDQAEVEQTVDRSHMWRALTPQMFRLGPLRRALGEALAQDKLVTDDASAMEQAGFRPLLVQGHGDNIKITHPADLALAELYLQQQARET